MEKVVERRFGIKDIADISSIIFKLYRSNFTLPVESLDKLDKKLQSLCPRSVHVADCFFRSFHYQLTAKYHSLGIVLAIY